MPALTAWLFLAPLALANTFLSAGPCPGDQRTAVTADGRPWCCLGRLELPGHRFMTAALVGPDLILTAAHGLVRAGRFKAGAFIFRPDVGNPHHRSDDSARALRAWLGSFTPDREADVHADWALLRLDRNLGDLDGTLAVRDVDAARLACNEWPLGLASYSRDFRRGRAVGWQTGGRLLALDPAGYLLHDFSTDHGASGAPVFALADGTVLAPIVALNVAEKTTRGETLRGIPFALQVANVAIASHEFFPTLHRLLAGDLSDPSYPLRQDR